MPVIHNIYIYISDIREKKKEYTQKREERERSKPTKIVLYIYT